MNRLIENAKTLASLINADSAEAAKLLEVAVAITCDEADAAALAIANDVREMLGRTVTSARLNDYGGDVDAELVIGAAPAHRADAIRLTVADSQIEIGMSARAIPVSRSAPGIALLVSGCYATGMTLRLLFGERLAVPGPAPAAGMIIPLRDLLGPDTNWATTTFNLDGAYLAGAGAVGNGFLYALGRFRVQGSLTIVDPDSVTDGNLNRCVFFTEDDIGHYKAERLAEHSRPALPNLRLIPAVATLQQLGKAKDGAWLRRLIVGVDSRRVRRHLQNEIPGEVFDASTTGAVECVLHHHRQPTEAACLACIYHETRDELAREKHIADALGIDVDDVKQHYVSSAAAGRIHTKYPAIAIEKLSGQAYDSLFKALCSEHKLRASEDRQVLAPFAFVSVLAGALLAIEVARRTIFGEQAFTFNYWRVSPWAPPVADLKQQRPRLKDCEFCREPVLLRISERFWGQDT